MLKPHLKVLGAILLMSGLSATVMAEEAAPAADAAPAAIEPKPDWTFPGSVSLVSDYIFRGQSQSWGRPSLQAAVEADHKSGLYVGISSESVSGRWLPGADIEVDYYGGFRGTLPSVASMINFDVGAIYYTYPGADWNKSAFPSKSQTLDTLEPYVALNYSWLTLKTGATVGSYFGWNKNNSGVGIGFAGDPKAGVTGNTSGSYYYEADGLYEFFPTWTVNGQLGRQVINNSRGLDITYFKAGVTKAFASGWSVAASYSVTNEPDAYKNFLSLENTTGQSDIAQDRFFVGVSRAF